jgi:actin-related protein 9
MDGEGAKAEVEVEVEGESDKRVGWVIGDELDRAKSEEGWEEKYEQKWPFRATAGTEDWEGRAFVTYVLSSSDNHQLTSRAHVITLLGLNVKANTSPLLLVPPPSPPSLPLPHQAAWAQLAFEDLSVPALSILPAPLASLYAVGATTGIVLHVGRDRSEIAVVTDSVIRWECSTTVEVGHGDCEVWLEDLLMKDQDLDKNLQMNMGGDGTWEAGQKEKMIKEVANVIWTECTGDDLEVPPAEAGSKAIAAVAAQAQEDDSFDVAKKYVHLYSCRVLS